MPGELERMKAALSLGREKSLLARMAGNIASGLLAGDPALTDDATATHAVAIAERILAIIEEHYYVEEDHERR
jgi:hypothetical protein